MQLDHACLVEADNAELSGRLSLINLVNKAAPVAVSRYTPGN